MAALTLLDHARQKGLDAVNRSPQIDFDDPFPIGMLHLGDRAAHRDAGVVEYDVHRAHFGERCIGEMLHRREIRDIANDAFDLRAR